MTKEEYQEYLRSEHWKGVKAQFKKRGIHKCYVCETKWPLELHHISYARLYREKRSDLIYLCAACHQEAHDFLRVTKGKNASLFNVAKILRGIWLKKNEKGIMSVKPSKTGNKRIMINVVEPTVKPPVLLPNGRPAIRDHGYRISR